MTADTIILLIAVTASTLIICLTLLLKKKDGGSSALLDEIDEQFNNFKINSDTNASLTRQEISTNFSSLGNLTARNMAALSGETKKSLSELKDELAQSRRNAELNQRLAADLMQKQGMEMRSEIVAQFTGLNEISLNASREMAQQNLQSISELKKTVEQNLSEIERKNEAALNLMRETVEKKLSESINTGLESSFKSVSTQLEQVYTSLGQMQNLTSDILDLKKVLGNVKNRGSWGETQLGNIISDMLAPNQYEKEKMLSRNRDRVDYAIRLPGEDGSGIWLPVDSKFPLDLYYAVQTAAETGEGYQKAMSELKNSALESAKSISKYVMPPETTDFAVMFVPSEGLFAALAADGLIYEMRTKHKVILAGPSTFCALLSSIQTGFRSLAIRKNSEEIFRLLGKVKKSFEQYQKDLEQASRSLIAAQNNLDKVSRSSGRLSGELLKIEELDSAEAKEV